MADEEDRARSVFVSGLKSAHALENQALELMNRQIERIENYPEVAARLKRHVEETHGQIERLETILGSLDESRSVLKDNALSFSGNMAAIAHSLTQDEILKNTFANFAFENFEAATYKSLILVAQNTGVQSAVAPLQQTLEEEEAMAQWIDQHLAEVTTRYLQRYEAGEKAGL
jgi:ferritin-like metal-binding protein YciE